jgi:hypothetical protein
MFDVVLEAARSVVKEKGSNRFIPPELYEEALKSYPDLRKNSFMARVIACTSDHPSQKYHVSKRDYFSRTGSLEYKLNDKYKEELTQAEMISQIAKNYKHKGLFGED